MASSINIEQDSFDRIREYGTARANIIYRIRDKWGTVTFAISPDGDGFYFYDTMQELEAEHV